MIMARRNNKIGRFTPFDNNRDLEKEKIRLDIEIIKSLRYKFKDDNEIRFHFDKIINRLLKIG